MTGISLSPRIFQDSKRTPSDERLIREFGCIDRLLLFLKGLGVSHIELRSVGKNDDPAQILHIAQKLWDSGFSVTVHASLPSEPTRFSEYWQSLLPLLSAAKSKGETTVITVHALTSGDDSNKAPASENTNRILKLWSEEAESLGFRIALEINRDKHNGDPSVSVSGVLEMLEGTDPRCVGICFDFGHYYSNVKTCGIPLLPDESFLKRVIHTHIHALSNGLTHFPIDESSELPLGLYTDALVRAGYTGVFNFEPDFPRYENRALRRAISSSVSAIRGAKTAAHPFDPKTRENYAKALDSLYPKELDRISKEITLCKTDCFWALGPSSQFFRLGGMKFAVDPAIRSQEARCASVEPMRAILSQADFVLITHSHDDHFDTDLIAMLGALPCKWIFGENFPAELIERAKIPAERATIVKTGEAIALNGAKLRVFNGSHFSPDGSGVPAVMYLLETAEKSVFFPGDVRDYGADKLPENIFPDLMFANLWLGRKKALNTDLGAYAEFCDYIALFRPKKVFLGHLFEHTRTPGDMWRYEHAGIVMDGLVLRLPSTLTVPLQPFCRYDI